MVAPLAKRIDRGIEIGPSDHDGRAKFVDRDESGCEFQDWDDESLRKKFSRRFRFSVAAARLLRRGAVAERRDRGQHHRASAH
jgi:hypothetical protein